MKFTCSIAVCDMAEVYPIVLLGGALLPGSLLISRHLLPHAANDTLNLPAVKQTCI